MSFVVVQVHGTTGGMYGRKLTDGGLLWATSCTWFDIRGLRKPAEQMRTAALHQAFSMQLLRMAAGVWSGLVQASALYTDLDA